MNRSELKAVRKIPVRHLLPPKHRWVTKERKNRQSQQLGCRKHQRRPRWRLHQNDSQGISRLARKTDSNWRPRQSKKRKNTKSLIASGWSTGRDWGLKTKTQWDWKIRCRNEAVPRVYARQTRRPGWECRALRKWAVGPTEWESYFESYFLPNSRISRRGLHDAPSIHSDGKAWNIWWSCST